MTCSGQTHGGLLDSAEKFNLVSEYDEDYYFYNKELNGELVQVSEEAGELEISLK